MTPRLYLEPSQLAPDDYVSERANLLRARPGVTGATWWANANPNREDLPRVLDEFSTLGVYEVDGAFEAPRPTAGWLFGRTTRPPQGILTGRPTIGLLLVLISPTEPEGAQSLRDWADFVHIRHIAAAAVPGYTMITPYENVTASDPRFLHLYEMDSPDVEAAFSSMTPRVIDRIGGPQTPAFKEWAMHPALRIMYVNTFRLAGSA